ncbi:MAG: helix-hairpin-helix domain-containing protein [Flavobacteriaceae bacterium]|nr:helix-hairpin-helix domain-containing protein [Flavobacteriaceae bacterium]
MKYKSLFWLNKSQRRGIFYLVFLLFCLIGISWFVSDLTVPRSLQLNARQQALIDSLKIVAKEDKKKTLKPFSSNSLTDYRAYILGLPPEVVDRYNRYKEANEWVDTKEKFLQATGISDTAYHKIAPWLIYPDKSNWYRPKTSAKKRDIRPVKNKVIIGLNAATADQLKSVRGIGAVLSVRIIAFREKLGGFVVKEQLLDVYGLEKEVVQRVWERFPLKAPVVPKKISINDCSLEELQATGCVSWKEARLIIAYRENNGKIWSFEELKGIEGFAVGKIERIQLYLSIE